jgi:hypothetical protein
MKFGYGLFAGVSALAIFAAVAPATWRVAPPSHNTSDNPNS